MSRTEVLAIEVKQYVDEAGEQQTIVPRVVGQTESARAVKGHRPVPLDWNESSILAALTELGSPARADTVSALIAWPAGTTTSVWHSGAAPPDSGARFSSSSTVP